MTPEISAAGTFLVLGGTGTVGSRVATQLLAAGASVRAVGRSTEPAFDWTVPDTWSAALDSVGRMYLLLPDGTDLPEDFLGQAAQAGVGKVVLHSDRGVDVMSVTRLQSAERAVRASSLEWTIVRPDWFNQNFETFFRQPVIDGRLCVPVGASKQGFVDADDIAAVAVSALSSGDHLGEILELTGPAALSFGEAADIISTAIGRLIHFDGTAEGYRAELQTAGLPADFIEAGIEQFAMLAARGDAEPTGTVEKVLGRPARSFDDYVTGAAARGVWR